MSDLWLFPTKTRLALLRDVARNLVWGDDGDVLAATGDGGRRKVTVQVADMCRAGWVRPGGLRGDRRRPYELTDAGRAVLDADGGAS